MARLQSRARRFPLRRGIQDGRASRPGRAGPRGRIQEALSESTQQDHPWIALEAWDRCQAPASTSRRAFVGLDLASTTDLAALVVLLADPDGGYTFRPEFFVPADSIVERARKDRVPYDVWARQGYLRPTPGNVIDVGVIHARLLALMREYEIVEIAADPWNLRDRIAEWQREGLPVVPVEQTIASLTTASKAFETLVLSRKLRHDGHPILRWCVANCCIDTDNNGNIKPSKKRSRDKIDGVSGAVTGLARALLHPTPAPWNLEEIAIIGGSRITSMDLW